MFSVPYQETKGNL